MISQNVLRRGAQTKAGQAALRDVGAECAGCGHPWGAHALREPHACETCGECPAFVPSARKKRGR